MHNYLPIKTVTGVPSVSLAPLAGRDGVLCAVLPPGVGCAGAGNSAERPVPTVPPPYAPTITYIKDYHDIV